MRWLDCHRSYDDDVKVINTYYVRSHYILVGKYTSIIMNMCDVYRYDTESNASNVTLHNTYILLIVIIIVMMTKR